MLSSLPQACAVNILDYVCYSGAVNDLELNLYGHETPCDLGRDPMEKLQTVVLAYFSVRGCVLQDGSVLLCPGQLPVFEPHMGVRGHMGIRIITRELDPKYIIRELDPEYIIFREHKGRLQASCLYKKWNIDNSNKWCTMGKIITCQPHIAELSQDWHRLWEAAPHFKYKLNRRTSMNYILTMVPVHLIVSRRGAAPDVEQDGSVQAHRAGRPVAKVQARPFS